MEDPQSKFSKTAPSAFTDYNKQNQTEHLIKWILSSSAVEQNNISLSNCVIGYTIKSIYHSNSLPYILHQMCPQMFPMKLTVSQMEGLFMEYFYREFGFYVKSLLLLDQRKQKMMVRLILYACIYSPPKEKFVANILKLQPDVQEKLVNEIEDVEEELKQIKNWDKMYEVIRKLQTQNSQLAGMIQQYQETVEKYEEQTRNLKQELQQTKKQLNLLVVQKRKMLGNFSLSSLASYEDLCLHLKIENEELSKKQQELHKIIEDLQKQVHILHQDLNNSDIVIADLNTQCYSLQKSYDQATRQLSTIQQSFIMQNESKIHSINKSLSATADMTMPSEIKPNKDSMRQNFPTDVFNHTNRSSFGEGKMSLGRNSRNSAAWNMFNTTKNNVLLNAKMQVFEQRIEQLKLKINEQESQIVRLEQIQKKYMKRTRKIQKLSDTFQNQYEIISGRYEIVE